MRDRLESATHHWRLVHASAVAILAFGSHGAVRAELCVHPQTLVPWPVFGDVTGSGSVNVADVSCVILTSLADLASYGPPGCLAPALGPLGADLDCDGETTVADALIAIMLSLGNPLGPTLDSTEDGCPDACDTCPADGAEQCQEPCTSDGTVSWTLSHGGAQIDFVTICPQTFVMGCTPGALACMGPEWPPMPVTLTRAYLMAQTPITEAQYEAVMQVNPSFTSRGPGYPVENLTWHMAAAFANAASLAEGRHPCYACSGSGHDTHCSVDVSQIYACEGYRLPTEAEWEAAARCGTDLTYAGSDQVDEVGWYSVNGGWQKRLVAEKAPNGCGLYDMSGNVYEWTNDWYDFNTYSSAGNVDPTGPGEGAMKLRRSGSWRSSEAECRVAAHLANVPHTVSDDLGFRIVRLASASP